MNKKQTGKIVIISSPSGGGKTSICRRLLSPARRRKGWGFSLSYTTRRPRQGERDSREYRFVTDAEFDKLAKKNFFAESCRVHLYRYGTPRKPLQAVLKKGGVMVLDIDVQGAFKLRRLFPGAITIFILPPSTAALRNRLRRRGTETREQLKVRFDNAQKEMKLFHKFDYVVINQELNVATDEVLAIITSHHCRTDRLNLEQMRGIAG